MYTEEQMIEVGGRPWTSADGEKHRVYLGWEDLIGFRIECFKSGSIRYAEVDGEKVSNRRAGQLQGIKVYWEGGQVRAEDPNGGWDGYHGKTENARYVLDAVLEVLSARLGTSDEQEFTEATYEVTLAVKGNGPVLSEEDLALAIIKGMPPGFTLVRTLIARLEA